MPADFWPALARCCRRLATGSRSFRLGASDARHPESGAVRGDGFGYAGLGIVAAGEAVNIAPKIKG
jgi:hypothetical protein